MSEENTQENSQETVTLTEEQEKEYLLTLKKKADLMGITYSNRIGVAALKEKINAKLEGRAEVSNEGENEAAEEAPSNKVETKQEIYNRLYAENMRMVRVSIEVHDPSKKDLQGEFFTFSNAVLGDVKYFVPYGEITENGWHIPYCIYKILKNKKYNHRDNLKKGQKMSKVEGRRAKMFSIDMLEPLTEEELTALAAEQAAKRSFED